MYLICKEQIKPHSLHKISLELCSTSKTPLKTRNKSSYEKIQVFSKSPNQTQRKKTTPLNSSFVIVRSLPEIKSKESITKNLKPIIFGISENQEKKLNLINELSAAKSSKKIKHLLPPLPSARKFLKNLVNVKSKYFGGTAKAETERIMKEKIVPKKIEYKPVKLKSEVKGNKKSNQDISFSNKSLFLSGWDTD